MTDPNATPGFLDTAAAAFLARRLEHQRMRAAAVRDREGTAAAPRHHPADEVPPLSIVIMTVGSRGDVQPFIPIARRLAGRHRVRLATHAVFRSLVEGAGLEFYPLGGDPVALMDHMVRSGGHIISKRLDRVLMDAPRQRAQITDILASTWRACTAPDPERPGAAPFQADLIIANPPSFGHIHCAEALAIPLHMIFTMPWSPTTVYPHPFAGLEDAQSQPLQNYLSYGAVDLVVWTGILDLVNAFRRDTLKLDPLSLVEGAGILEDHGVPFTYLWPDALMPRPADWPPHVELANFTFYDQAHGYQPPTALAEFLAAGEAPIYVGFGSVLVEDAPAVARRIFTALEKAGARGVVSQGWAQLGGGTPPPNVFVIGDTPHDWLFPRCRAVCHHGGAGTTSAGLRAGLPTVVVPTFGDQYFWGRMVADAGAGPEPIPIARLDTATLTAAFDACRRPQIRERAEALGARLRAVDGAELAVQSVYRWLPVEAMRCAVHPERLATLECIACGRQRLCPECVPQHAADLKRPCRYVDWDMHPDPELAGGFGDLVSDTASALRAGFGELVSKLAPRSTRAR
ncbi:MAG TPA: glycosyltransferase [Methylomirabilota bacterium]|nr:glycosyltransferase [Methylomirabilota bacterium]